MLWSSALHSPQKREHHIWCAHETAKQFHVCKVWVSPPQTQCLGVDHGDFRHLDQKMSTVTKQCQMRVAVSAAVVCLRGANYPSSTEILITTTPLYYTYTSNSNPPIIILHSHSSNQITSFTSFPSTSIIQTVNFPRQTQCPVCRRLIFNVSLVAYKRLGHCWGCG